MSFTFPLKYELRVKLTIIYISSNIKHSGNNGIWKYVLCFFFIIMEIITLEIVYVI